MREEKKSKYKTPEIKSYGSLDKLTKQIIDEGDDLLFPGSGGWVK
ncbi:hypothetical protein [Methanobacterium petrolearium]|nr:hypothetical protein [Methanobacterium petrolearium]MBP1946608.1 hypothetical protein [Methanobacterium petrolearium]BDZ72170.1 hypothetical protein GCM10025861_26870 [Methanobacterium petrolearium]